MTEKPVKSPTNPPTFPAKEYQSLNLKYLSTIARKPKKVVVEIRTSRSILT